MVPLNSAHALLLEPLIPQNRRDFFLGGVRQGLVVEAASALAGGVFTALDSNGPASKRFRKGMAITPDSPDSLKLSLSTMPICCKVADSDGSGSAGLDLRSICANIHKNKSVEWNGSAYKDLQVIGLGNHNIIYRLAEEFVLRALQDSTSASKASSYRGPSISYLNNIMAGYECLCKANLPVAAIENVPQRDGYVVQRYIPGNHLSPFDRLPSANRWAIAKVVRDFIDFSLKEKQIVDLQLTNFIVHQETMEVWLVDIYEYPNEDVRMEMQAFLKNFLKDFCSGDRKVYTYLTKNIGEISPKISGYLKDLEERGELPKAESSTELQATQGLAGAGLGELVESSTPLSKE